MDKIKQFEPLFGDWYAESFIGAGSYGRVYKIYRDEIGNRFYSALKYISIPADENEVNQLRADGMDDQSISTYFSTVVRDISAETTLMNQLRGNTNIVSFEDSRISPKENGVGYDIFIRMELLEGLTNRMMNAPLSKDEVVKLGTDICSALILCFKRGIIHRDIKPDNIFISPNGDFKLGDFGIARQLEKTSSFMSKKGTYNYMAPEVYKGEKYGAACDIYSLGLVMYRLLNRGRLPFLPPAPEQITSNDREESLKKRFMGETIPAPADADERLAAIVLKACAYRQEDRYASAEELRDDLVRYKRGEPVKAAQSAAPAFCPKCGTKLPAGAVFCRNCGTNITAAKPSQPVRPTPVQPVQPVRQQPVQPSQTVRPAPVQPVRPVRAADPEDATGTVGVNFNRPSAPQNSTPRYTPPASTPNYAPPASAPQYAAPASAPIREFPGQTPVQPAAGGYSPQPKKSKKGLIIGIAAAAAVVIAAVVLIIVLTGNKSNSNSVVGTYRLESVNGVNLEALFSMNAEDIEDDYGMTVSQFVEQYDIFELASDGTFRESGLALQGSTMTGQWRREGNNIIISQNGVDQLTMTFANGRLTGTVSGNNAVYVKR